MSTNTKWFVVLHDGHTNEALARELAQASLAMEGETEIEVNGKKTRAWELPHRYVTQLKHNRKVFGLRYTVYVQEGNGQVRQWKLDAVGTRRTSRKYVAAQNKLKQLADRKRT